MSETTTENLSITDIKPAGSNAPRSTTRTSTLHRQAPAPCDAQPGPRAEAFDELASVFAVYNETTNRLRKSHQNLQKEVARLSRQLQQKNEQLQRRDRLAALGQMAAGMAHEIRNPLGGIQLYTSLLARDLAGLPEPLKWVQKISKGVQTLDSIVNDILAFTQDQICNKTQVNLADLIRETLDYLLPQTSTLDVKIDLSMVDKELSIQADINMMRRVFFNLLRNALEATGHEGNIKISAAPYRENPPYQVHISISDDGEGIPPEVMNKMFNPFYTTKDVGTGLGLTIVHRLVEVHGGLITGANNETGGATFNILLP